MQNGRHMSKSRSGKDLFARKIITIKVSKQRWSRKYNLLLDFYLFSSFFSFIYFAFFLYCWYALKKRKLNEYCFFIGAIVTRCVMVFYWRLEFLCFNIRELWEIRLICIKKAQMPFFITFFLLSGRLHKKV